MAEGRYSWLFEPHMAKEELWAWWVWEACGGWCLVLAVALELYQGSVQVTGVILGICQEGTQAWYALGKERA